MIVKTKNESGSLEDTVLKMHCPKCGNNYTHLEGYAPYFDKPDNRLCIKLLFSCEDGCIFAEYVHQHEGETFLTDDEEVI